LADGAEVGQGAAEPSLGDPVHAHVGDALLDDVLGLALRADEADVAALGDGAGDELLGQKEPLDRLLDVDDVDAVALAVDEPRHLRVPRAGALAEVDPRFDEVLDEGVGHGALPFRAATPAGTDRRTRRLAARPKPAPGRFRLELTVRDAADQPVLMVHPDAPQRGRGSRPPITTETPV